MKKSRRQQKAADQQSLRRICASIGLTPHDLSRLTGASESRCRDMLLGRTSVRSGLIAYLEDCFFLLPAGGVQDRIDTIVALRAAVRTPGVETVILFNPVDPKERAEMKRKLEAGLGKMTSLCGTVHRPMDPDERERLLKELDRPYRATAVSAH